MGISFHGQSCVCIETAERKHLLIDPFISGNPLSDLDPDAVLCDVILLTHGHSDHVSDTERIARRTNPLIISTVELAGYPWVGHDCRRHALYNWVGIRYPAER